MEALILLMLQGKTNKFTILNSDLVLSNFKQIICKFNYYFLKKRKLNILCFFQNASMFLVFLGKKSKSKAMYLCVNFKICNFHLQFLCNGSLNSSMQN